MRSTVIIIVLILTFSFSQASGEDLTQFWEFSSGDWSGGAYKDTDGAFSHCYISAHYVSGITMALGLTRDYEIALVLGKNEWKLPIGETYHVSLTIDGKRPRRFPSIVKETW